MHARLTTEMSCLGKDPVEQAEHDERALKMLQNTTKLRVSDDCTCAPESTQQWSPAPHPDPETDGREREPSANARRALQWDNVGANKTQQSTQHSRSAVACISMDR